MGNFIEFALIVFVAHLVFPSFQPSVFAVILVFFIAYTFSPARIAVRQTSPEIQDRIVFHVGWGSAVILLLMAAWITVFPPQSSLMWLIVLMAAYSTVRPIV